jgi:signal transduction histidine kinase
MTEAPARPPWRGRPFWRGSVFVKLLAIMLTMGAALLVIVAAFFWFLVHQGVGIPVEHALGEYARTIADDAPDLEKARAIGARLHVRIRYEGPRGSWATSDELPSIAEARRQIADGQTPPWGRSRYLVAAKDGGTYLFAWEFGQRLFVVHNNLLWSLHGLMLATVLVAYIVIRHALRPLRTLQEGVMRLSEGQLDIALPKPTRDEFGDLTAAFNQMVARVKEMLRARDQLLLDVSHELRSPLTRMKVALALLPDGEKKAGMAADVAEMEAMITELLELERLRGGRGIRPERRDLVPLLRDVAADFATAPPGVRLGAGPAELWLDIDADRVRTVLRNLVENALKYSLADSRPVELSAARNGEVVVVRVVDDGPGIPEADLPRLFEPFFRVDRSRSKKTGGYGLGLSICERIMQAHGGTITAANGPVRGATFTLAFPAPA